MILREVIPNFRSNGRAASAVATTKVIAPVYVKHATFAISKIAAHALFHWPIALFRIKQPPQEHLPPRHPLPLHQHLTWPKRGFVGHFGAGFYPVAQVHMGQAQGAGLGYLP
jgi:hypothetical protein